MSSIKYVKNKKMQKCHFDDLENKLVLDLTLSLNPINIDDEEVEVEEEEIDI